MEGNKATEGKRRGRAGRELGGPRYSAWINVAVLESTGRPRSLGKLIRKERAAPRTVAIEVPHLISRVYRLSSGLRLRLQRLFGITMTTKG